MKHITFDYYKLLASGDVILNDGYLYSFYHILERVNSSEVRQALTFYAGQPCITHYLHLYTSTYDLLPEIEGRVRFQCIVCYRFV